MISNNNILFERAKKSIPGGVNSPVRSFRSVGGTPRFISRAQGPYLWDVNGKQYIDYISSWGTMIVGHVHPDVLKAVQDVLIDGFSFGTPNEAEIKIAEEICKLVPSIEQVRMVSSGTEATMSALRLARGFTSRSHVIMFEGCYHGHVDSLLVKSSSVALNSIRNRASSGIPSSIEKDTTVLEFNNITALEEVFQNFGNKISAVIVEPVAGNMNMVRGTLEFIKILRDLCTKYGAILIFDEVISGFRISIGGAQEYYGISPDLTCLGKIVGGGMPAAAFGGRRDIMAKLSPLGEVYQGGTLSGNPIAIAAGLKTLQLIQEPGFYDNLAKQTKRLTDGLSSNARAVNITFCTDSIGSMFGLYFTENVPMNYSEVIKNNTEHFNKFFHLMLDAGMYFPPSAHEVGFISSAHNDTVIDETLSAARRIFSMLID